MIGRGAASNPVNRFTEIECSVDPEDDVAPDAPRTRFFRDLARSIIAYNASPDVGFEASLNPYRGCEHGCVYCYARPTHEYLGLSAGLDFETQIFVKEEAPTLLRRELSARKWKPQTIVISGVTDCYQPAERRFRLTRACLEVLADFGNPVGIITKNHLVTRDIDILRELARFDCVSVAISITTLDHELARVMEPRTSTPARKLDAIRALSDAGIPTTVMIAPVVPGLTEHELPAIAKAAADAGAQSAGYVMLRLPHAVAPLFEKWLEEHFPDRKEKILNRLKSLRGGKLYDSEWGSRMTGEGIFADQIENLFRIATKRAGLDNERFQLSTSSFRPLQPSLFDAV